MPERADHFDVPAPAGNTVRKTIRDHPAGHDYGPGNAQNRRSHFNGPDGRHYDYQLRP